MLKLSALFSVPVEQLLDDYNLFLFRNQGLQIKKMRKMKNMSQKQFSAFLGVPFGTLQQWEQNRVIMFKSSWEKMMEKIDPITIPE